jgi:DNA-binding Lrp family transcriptional regulator
VVDICSEDARLRSESKVNALQGELESSKKRGENIKQAAEKIRKWAQSRVEKDYEEIMDTKDMVEERLKSLEEVKKHIEAFGK